MRRTQEFDEFSGDPDFWPNVHAMSTISEKITAIADKIKEASLECFNEVPPMMRKSFLSQETWGMIQQREVLRNQGHTQEAKDLSKEISKEAKKDRTSMTASKTIIFKCYIQYIPKLNLFT